MAPELVGFNVKPTVCGDVRWVLATKGGNRTGTVHGQYHELPSILAEVFLLEVPTGHFTGGGGGKVFDDQLLSALTTSPSPGDLTEMWRLKVAARQHMSSQVDALGCPILPPTAPQSISQTVTEPQNQNTIYCDASVSSDRRFAGLGCITEAGWYTSDTAMSEDSINSADAELLAIAMAAKQFHENAGVLRIVTDLSSAPQIIKEFKRKKPLTIMAKYSWLSTTTAQQLYSIVRLRSLRVVWARRCSTPHLVVADRLAHKAMLKAEGCGDSKSKLQPNIANPRELLRRDHT